MKKLFAFIFILLNSVMMCAQDEILIGMNIDEVKEILPGLKESRYENEVTLGKKINLFGLEDEFAYRFENGKLNWMYFHKYISEITEDNFNKCLLSARQIIKEFSNLYGKPDIVEIGDTIFLDPYKKRHWGYDVIEARWKNYKNMKVKVEFTFMGGKGEYNFIVSVNYFGKDYPFFD